MIKSTSWLGKFIEMQVSGCKVPIEGEIVELGQDLIVLYGDQKFIYVPLHHIQNMQLITKTTTNTSDATLPIPNPEMEHDHISYRKMLMNARGRFSEISIGGQTLQGYITSIMNDYFIFFSPLHHSVYLSIHHLKYIIPSPANHAPFSLNQQHFPMQPTSMPLSRTLDQQLQKMVGDLVIVNMGLKPYRAGLLKEADSHLIKLIEADGNAIIMHTNHIQSIHLP